MSIPAAQAEVAAFLRGLAKADPVETHISLVYLGRDTVWKLKKAVRLSFLDFTRPEDRRRFADREFALNAAAAPGLYRDVVPVVRRPDGSLDLGGPSDAPVLDWVVRMARVPADDFLDEVARLGGLTPQRLDAVADAVAAYHNGLPPLTGYQPDMARTATGNARAACEAGLPDERVLGWESAILAGLARRDAWLRARAAAGFVRRGHGDLHLGNLCLWQGRPVPFDALEFDEDLATTDLAYDLAFLLMDLDLRVDRAAANRVMNRYVARTGDAALVCGLPVFLSMRAMIRAHVQARMGKQEAAIRYLDAAEAYLRPSSSVVAAIGGLPGTGKSTLARALAPSLGAAPGALILRSDESRKRRFGVAPEQRLPQNAYTPEISNAVFADLAALTRQAAAGGHCVIADATFIDPAHRRMLSEAAAQAGVPFVGLWLQAPLAELEQRIRTRTGDASDATVEVLRAAARNDPGAGGWLAVPATDAAAAQGLAAATLKSHLVPRQ
ncbi:MAG: AAA family ATPase [Acetobacteraceae bacterium]